MNADQLRNLPPSSLLHELYRQVQMARSCTGCFRQIGEKTGESKALLTVGDFDIYPRGQGPTQPPLPAPDSHRCFWCGELTTSMHWACARCQPLKEEGYRRAKAKGLKDRISVLAEVCRVLKENNVPVRHASAWEYGETPGEIGGGK